jgi:hypothetical protein
MDSAVGLNSEYLNSEYLSSEYSNSDQPAVTPASHLCEVTVSIVLKLLIYVQPEVFEIPASCPTLVSMDVPDSVAAVQQISVEPLSVTTAPVDPPRPLRPKKLWHLRVS